MHCLAIEGDETQLQHGSTRIHSTGLHIVQTTQHEHRRNTHWHIVQTPMRATVVRTPVEGSKVIEIAEELRQASWL